MPNGCDAQDGPLYVLDNRQRLLTIHRRVFFCLLFFLKKELSAQSSASCCPVLPLLPSCRSSLLGEPSEVHSTREPFLGKVISKDHLPSFSLRLRFLQVAESRGKAHTGVLIPELKVLETSSFSQCQTRSHPSLQKSPICLPCVKGSCTPR